MYLSYQANISTEPNVSISPTGYKYFGAAKDLPGVRQLFEEAPPPPPRKNRGDLMKVSPCSEILQGQKTEK